MFFFPVPFPFPHSLWHRARPEEEGGRKGSEKVREGRAFWGIPPPPEAAARDIKLSSAQLFKMLTQNSVLDCLCGVQGVQEDSSSDQLF